MSLVLNMIGGGGSFTATDAILRVQAPANSVVTISKGSTVKTDYGHENADDNTVYDYYFIIHQSQFDGFNPWFISAVTPESLIITDSIIINSSDEYDVTLDSILPSGYQRVEFLESTGTQWMDSFYLSGWDTNCHFEIDVMPKSTGAFINNYRSIGGTTYEAYRLVISSSTVAEVGFGTSDSKETYTIALNNRYKFSIDTSYNGSSRVYTITYKLDGSDSKQKSVLGYNNDRWMPLFAERNDSSTPTNFISGRIYGMYCSKGSSDVANYVPCYRISDSVAGFYDTVSNTFKINQGTGTFIVGEPR